jgi:hypothetical protein
MGQKFASYNSSGTIIAFYDDVDSPVPVGANVIAITDDEWFECLTTQAHTVVDGVLTAPPEKTNAELLSEAIQSKIAELSAACQSAILSGFTSTALGVSYSYPSSMTDQQNLASSVLASLMPSGTVAGWVTPFWCADIDGVWAFRSHNAEQIQQVGEDGKLAILTNMAKNDQIATSAKAATTVAEVAAITWN